MAESNVNEEGASDKPTENSTEKKLSADAFQNFIQGKRHMLVQDYTNAVTSLADACQLYVEHFGQTAFECGEVYFHYGKALFRLFQQQSGIIGTLVSDESSNEKNSDSEEDKEKENTDDTSNENEDDDDNDDNEEDDEEDLDDDEALSNKDDSSKEDPAASTNSETKSDPVKVENTEQADVSSAAGGDSQSKSNDNSISKVEDDEKAHASCDPELDKAGPSKPKTEEEVSDLQLAWETLETAKSIFKRQGDDNRDAQLKVAEILLILSEISMELENYEAAVGDLKECISIRERYLEADDRLIAEAFYQLGLVYTFDSQIELAMESYQRSMDCILLRIVNLKKQTVIKKTPEGFDINPADEISELEAIIPDIKGKMEDTRDMVRDTKSLMKELAFQSMEEAKAESSSSNKPATNITHLLKRKKPDDQETASPISVKKPKLTASSGEDQVNMKPETSTSSDSV